MAPDAQIITMKVFGKGGGAYDSDYMAAIEDAIVLGCDSVNLSLGSGNPGFARNTTYQEILDGLADSDTMVVMSAGNSGHWAENSKVGTGYLYGDDVNFATSGSPGTYTNALNVASGASMLTAIASGGYAELYDDEDNVTRDTELFYLLDDAGYIWTWWVYADNGSYSASLNFVETDLPDLEFPPPKEEASAMASRLVKPVTSQNAVNTAWAQLHPSKNRAWAFSP